MDIRSITTAPPSSYPASSEPGQHLCSSQRTSAAEKRRLRVRPAERCGHPRQRRRQLPDRWETSGYHADTDGVVDVDLPALGADPYRRDICSSNWTSWTGQASARPGCGQESRFDGLRCPETDVRVRAHHQLRQFPGNQSRHRHSGKPCLTRPDGTENVHVHEDHLRHRRPASAGQSRTRSKRRGPGSRGSRRAVSTTPSEATDLSLRDLGHSAGQHPHGFSDKADDLSGRIRRCGPPYHTTSIANRNAGT